MVVFGLGGCTRTKVVVYVESGFVRKNGCIRVNFLYLGKSCCIWAKLVVFGTKWLYLGKGGCIRSKWFYLGKSCLIRAKVVVIV